jgi:hypothetical protein
LANNLVILLSEISKQVKPLSYTSFFTGSKNLKLRLTLHSILFLLLFTAAPAQNLTEDILLSGIIVDGDTLPYMELKEAVIQAPAEFVSKKEVKKINKLIRDVKKAYPYAKIAGVKLKELDLMLAQTKNEKDKKELLKQAEDDLVAQFEEDIKNMTFSQGVILLKLIDRETGTTSYEIVKEFRGTLRAFFWQSLGVIFGINLKTEYEPEGDDKKIEEIVKMIEEGTL